MASSKGARVALHDLGGKGPLVLFAHANGFCGQIWQPVAVQLSHVARCWALDFRGHGDSVAGPEEDYHWANMADDVLTAVAMLDPPPRLAAGHSLGGAAILKAELAQPGTFDRAWLFEPIALPEEALSEEVIQALSEVALKRQRVFASRQVAYERYSTRTPLSVLTSEILQIYLDSGFRDLPDGTVTMKCAPEVEAAVVMNLDISLFDDLHKVVTKITVCAGADSDPPAQLAFQIAEALPNGSYECFGHLTHLGPLQDPQGAAASILASLF